MAAPALDQEARQAVKVRLVVRVANAAAVSNPRMAKYVTRQALAKPGVHGVPDLVLLSEVSPVSVAEIARSAGIAASAYVVQRGRVGSPEAGVAVVSRLPIRPKRSIVGSPAVRGKVRMRPILGASIGRLPVWAIHAPPGRSPVARALYIARARRRGGLCGGDWNQPPRWMRRTTRRKYRGLPGDVLGLMIPRRYRASKAVGVDIGSDHPAADVVVHIPAWRLRRARP